MNFREKSYHKGEAVHRQANDIAKRMWEAVGPPDMVLSLEVLTGALICFALQIGRNMLDTDAERAAYFDSLAASLKASIAPKPGTHEPPAVKQ